jgi:UDP-glucose-4-epimerase GalE
MKTVVITGGCGYIGSHIAKLLKLHNYYVVIIDIVENIKATKYANEFIHQDFDSERSYATIKQLKPDAIIHCAGYISTYESVIDPAIYYDNNVVKSIRFFSWIATLEKRPKIIFSSSASVYGNSNTSPIAESAQIAPITPYGRSKAIVENLLLDLKQAYYLDFISLRYFNACGADPVDFSLGQDINASHIVPNIIKAKLNNGTFTINGDGSHIRDYIHVWDLADAHLKALEYYSGGLNSLTTFNIATNVGIKNIDVVNRFIDLFGDVKIKHGPNRSGDPLVLYAWSDLARDVLGWKPIYSDLDTILITAWKWHNEK